MDCVRSADIRKEKRHNERRSENFRSASTVLRSEQAACGAIAVLALHVTGTRTRHVRIDGRHDPAGWRDVS